MSKNNVNVDFGNILKKTREARKMSQEEFAEFCDISRAYYGRIERGEHSITLDLCSKISQALGISIASLFEDLP
ncbi:MAG: helix-turn-helix transcriptional regulator [Lacrimispora sp.]